jgi:hypothetical protein
MWTSRMAVLSGYRRLETPCLRHTRRGNLDVTERREAA